MFQKIKIKDAIFWVWIVFIAAMLYFYFFKNELIRSKITQIMNFPVSWRYVIYLILGCVRGFTFIPVTYLIILGLLYLPAGPAYILTIAGVMVSSACIYYFAEYLGL